MSKGSLLTYTEVMKVMPRSFPRLEMLIVAISYFLAWWPQLLLGRGIFWDDWVFEPADFLSLIAHFREHGTPWNALLYAMLNWLDSWRPVVLFVVYFLAVLLWHRILIRLPGVNPLVASMSVAVSVAAPLFIARFSFVQAWSVVGLVFFLTAWNVIISQRLGRRARLQISGALLALAFMTYLALVPLTVAIVVHLLWLRRSQSAGNAVGKSEIATLFLIASTALLVKELFFDPSGTYQGYQSIRWSLPLFLLAALTLLLLTLAMLSIYREPIKPHPTTGKSSTVTQLLLGSLMALLAIGPYAATGAFPPYFEWQTRYEVSLFLGLSLSIHSLVTMAVNFSAARARHLMLVLGVLSLAWGVSQSSSVGLDFLRDSQKQNALVSQISALADPLEGKFIVVIDYTKSGNAMGRTYRHYEWSGILHKAFGTQNTYAVGADSNEAAIAAYGNYLHNGTPRPSYDYTWRLHLNNSKGYIVTIEENTEKREMGFLVDYREID